MTGIYKITSPKGKVYIGQAVNIKSRFASYKRIACKGQKKLYASLVKYGVEKHKFEIVVECLIPELNELERYYQDLYGCIGFGGMNLKLTTCETRSGCHSEETKRKISLGQVGRVHRSGFKLTEEHKAKIGLSKIGKKRPDASARIAAVNAIKVGDKNNFFGRQHTAETKLEISLKRKGKCKGESSPFSKLVLNLDTGIFYHSVTEAAIASNKRLNHLSRMLTGERKNSTSFIYC